jgi:hypothetical protein
MCRNIKTLYNFDPPATDADVRAAALQYVRKVSGYTKPSQANEDAFHEAVEDVARITTRLLEQLTTTAAPRDRALAIERTRARRAADEQRIIDRSRKQTEGMRTEPRTGA